MADFDTVTKVTGAAVGFADPIGLKIKLKIYADREVISMKKLHSGANRNRIPFSKRKYRPRFPPR